jgi:hypothetical protein
MHNKYQENQLEVPMNNGYAIALAWPETLCKKAGAWYDIPMHYLGFSKDGYYRVGHAAVVLVNAETGDCQYFDFGRYHAPHGSGRVRSVYTDHELAINTKATFAEGANQLANTHEILSELYQNPSTHGTGTIYGAVSPINLQSALEKALKLQEADHIPYGPFAYRGSNCSRFVCDAVLAGKPGLLPRFKLNFPWMLTPSPMWNLRASSGEIVMCGPEVVLQESNDHPSEMATA